MRGSDDVWPIAFKDIKEIGDRQASVHVARPSERAFYDRPRILWEDGRW
jgi:hypothetical protein